MANGGSTWGAALAEVERLLGQAGVDEPRVDAELLVSHVVGRTRTEVRLWSERVLSDGERERLGELVRRRAAREPLAYLLGTREFMGLSFGVDRRVLVPRWDSEVLVERFVALFAGGGAVELADIGTGSGALAVSLAVLLPRATVWATDRSAAALGVAVENASRNGVAARVRFLCGDLGEPLVRAGLTGRLAGIISNPPYVPTGVLAGLAPEIRDHEPREALDGGLDGLGVIRRLAAVATLLRPGGWLLVECGDDQAAAAMAALAAGGLEPCEVVRDLGGRDRGVLLRRVA